MATTYPPALPDLLDSIYAAAAGEVPWMEAAQRLHQATAANTAALLWCEPDRVDLLGAPGTPDDAMALYARHFHAHDPWATSGHAIVAEARRLGCPRGAVLGPEIVPEAAFRRSEFHNDFARRNGMFHLLGAMQPVNGSATLLIGLHRPEQATPFGTAERVMLDAALPHLRRGLNLWSRLEYGRGTSAAALDALSAGVVVVDAAMRVLHLNAAAERIASAGGIRLLRDGRATRLAAEHRIDQARLAARVAAVAHHGEAGGGVALRRRAGGILAAQVMRLPPRCAAGPAAARGAALILLRDTGRPALPPSALLCDLFGLTGAEAAVALAVAAGGTAEAIAKVRQTSVNTVRTQLRAALEKCGAANLRDLATLLAALSA